MKFPQLIDYEIDIENSDEIAWPPIWFFFAFIDYAIHGYLHHISLSVEYILEKVR